MNSGVWTLNDMMNQLSALSADQEPYIEPFVHGTMRLGMYAPKGHDGQSHHDQDELYFVISGSGLFVHGDDITKFNPGDALFVAAGVRHRFEDFTEDFSAWVVFWGKRGGELEGN